jgi:hypothetical protein
MGYTFSAVGEWLGPASDTAALSEADHLHIGRADALAGCTEGLKEGHELGALSLMRSMPIKLRDGQPVEFRAAGADTLGNRI